MTKHDPAVYVLKSADLYKIGTTRDLQQRLRQLRAMSAKPVDLVLTVHWAGAPVERWIHRALRRRRNHGEWFDLTQDDLDALALFNAYPRDTSEDIAANPGYLYLVEADRNASLAERFPFSMDDIGGFFGGIFNRLENSQQIVSLATSSSGVFEPVIPDWIR